MVANVWNESSGLPVPTWHQPLGEESRKVCLWRPQSPAPCPLRGAPWAVLPLTPLHLPPTCTASHWLSLSSHLPMRVSGHWGEEAHLFISVFSPGFQRSCWRRAVLWYLFLNSLLSETKMKSIF